jgi:molybdenum cofactor synthesis domain-containing protein
VERRNPPPQRRAPDRRPPEGSRPGRRHTPAGVAPKGLVERTGPLHVEIIVVGRELLRGRTVDANASHLAGWLSQRGAIVHRITTVDDHDRAIAEAVTEAIERGARLVITTGGLGPTSDDRTLGAVADALRLPLAIHPHARQMVESAYLRLERERVVPRAGLTPAREKMCAIPVGSEPIPNESGTAPGVIVRRPGGVTVLCLPGVPEEARAVFHSAMDRLREIAPRGAVAQRDVETPTADESLLRPILDRLAEEFPLVWVKSHAPGFRRGDDRIRVTLEACAATEAEAEAAVENALRRLLALAGGG